MRVFICVRFLRIWVQNVVIFLQIIYCVIFLNRDGVCLLPVTSSVVKSG